MATSDDEKRKRAADEKGFTLDQIGLAPEELQRRVVETIAISLMKCTAHDEDGISYPRSTEFASAIEAKVCEALDTQVAAIAEEHIVPRVGEMIENATLQKTNEYGEKRGASLTFTEYLVQRAEAYLMEPVDFDGKPVDGSRYSGRKEQTRVTHLVDRHLAHTIERAMKEAVKNAHEVLAEGLAETAKIKLAEIAKNLKVSVTSGR